MDERIKPYEEKMTKTMDVLTEEYASIRAGRANPHLIDKIRVDYYGTPSPISQVANVSVPEARIIQIQPWESKMIKEIEKAINMSDIGINPTDDGKIIRLVFPELTEERRKDLAKEVKKKAEDAKVALRNIRRDANDTVKKMGKASEISEDVQKQLEGEIDKMTEKFVAEADKKMEEKTKEIMTV
ncbi:MAG: ribosome recycling factor [Lachnospiraceae bacterium]|nr:ribosome recycling factor [Lachnospiraceae bacterium]MBR5967695.1 ribosome recycling factor [Lachnospiraceae bacterium]